MNAETLARLEDANDVTPFLPELLSIVRDAKGLVEAVDEEIDLWLPGNLGHCHEDPPLWDDGRGICRRPRAMA